LLPPCDELLLESAEPSPLLSLLELELLSLLLELELLELEVELELVPSSELAVVPPESDWLVRTATARPVPPTPSRAVAIAAAEARRSQRVRLLWGSKASLVTMPEASPEAIQAHAKGTSSPDQVLLRVC
jgi:hypothetical protein